MCWAMEHKTEIQSSQHHFEGENQRSSFKSRYAFANLYLVFLQLLFQVVHEGRIIDPSSCYQNSAVILTNTLDTGI